MKWWPCECKSGDMIRVKLGSIYHYGIFVSEDEVIQFGLPPIPENQGKELSTVVCETDINEFSCGKIVEAAKFDFKEKLKKFSAGKVVKLARNRLGEGGYNIIHNNCEHFVYECVFGEKRSPQTEEIRKRWNNRPILDVYLVKISEEEKISDVFPTARNEEISSCNNEKTRRLKYSTWKLLEYAAKRTFGLEMPEISFKKKRSGKWICDRFSFSISHTDNFAAVAVSNKDVGIDIEEPNLRVRKYDDKISSLTAMAEKVYTSYEEEHFSKSEIRDFLSVWTKKEAIYKCKELSAFRPKDIESVKYPSVTYEISEPSPIIISVCSDNMENANYYIVENGECTSLDKKMIEI